MKLDIKLVLILVLALAVRFYMLSSIPFGLHRDEASAGYNAYTILKTGKDEYGRFLPLVFEAFGDWKRPINIYLTVPAVAIFGLNVFSVRLPIALTGFITVVVLYFLAKELFDKKIAFWTAFILAISPWHIFMSRNGLGWNVVGLFFSILGFFAFVLSFKKEKLLILSSVFWGVSLFSYASNQLFTPLYLMVLFLFFFKKILKNKYFFVSFLVFGLFLGLFVKVYLPVFKTNSKGSSFINPNFTYTNIEQKRIQAGNSLRVKLIYNKYTIYSTQFVKNYLTAISPSTLFYPQDANAAYSLDKQGNLYYISLVFIILGVFYLQKKRHKYRFVLYIWTLMAFLPAALTIEPRASTRSLLSLLPISLFAGVGIVWGYQLLRSKKLYSYLIGLGYLLSFGYFLYAYFIDFPVSRAVAYAYGWDQIIKLEEKKKPERVYTISPDDQYYVFYLFYHKIDPVFYWQSVKRGKISWDGFERVLSFGKYSFVYSFEDIYTKNIMFVSRVDYNKGMDNGEFIKLPNGKEEYIVLFKE